jgi:hypothetical protein
MVALAISVMFTTIALIAAALIGWRASRQNNTDLATYNRYDDDEAIRHLLLHTRQDLRLIAYLLVAILIMLGPSRINSAIKLIPPTPLDHLARLRRVILSFGQRFTPAR